MHGASALSLPFERSTDLPLHAFLRGFDWKGSSTAVSELRVATDDGATLAVETFTNEFWTAKQRAAHSLHEISYRACFKPQLPRFFIERLTRPGDIVYDPFMGRGTTLVEAALTERRVCGCDVNPLSRVLCEPRLQPPTLDEVQHALNDVDFHDPDDSPGELLVFYHPNTLRQLSALKKHLVRKQGLGTLSRADRWIRMVAVNRLTGHSPGFFSVYTLPPNQAVSAQSQAKINARLRQAPPERDVRGIILAKSRALLRDCTPDIRARLDALAPSARLLVGSSSDTPEIQADSVALAVTSPPFLDIVDYKTDNWLRCWFCGIDATAVPVTLAKRLDAWKQFVVETLREVRRVLRPGGHVAFEVGEVRGGALRLDETVIPAGISAGLEPVLVLVNAQHFTKTANCWGVTNNRKGTNTNRVVLFRKTRGQT
jgi:DNA methylase